MSWKTIMWLAAIGLLLAGCGGEDTLPMDEGDYEQHFGTKFRVPSDHSVKISANPLTESHAAGDEVVLNLTVSNMAKTARRLPLGLETDEGLVYTYFQALVRRDGGAIERVDITADGGTLVALDLASYETAAREFIVSNYYGFDTPGTYQIVLFYSVKDEALPDRSTPDWSGTVWTSPITIVIE